MAEPSIRFEGVSKSFGEQMVLKNLSLDVAPGEFLTIIGRSGCGKTTALRLVNALIAPDGGRVLVKGRDAAQADPAALRRGIGYTIQNVGLFPHMTVRQNLIEPYRMTTPGATDGEEKCRRLLEKVGLWDKADVYPSKLSGGQKQRVAIARALMKSPELMLFDEPTSALDPQLTGEVLSIMRQLAQEHMTMLVVTHEMSFARDAATRVLFMKDGTIAEEGPPTQIFTRPQNPETAAFLGTAAR